MKDNGTENKKNLESSAQGAASTIEQNDDISLLGEASYIIAKSGNSGAEVERNHESALNHNINSKTTIAFLDDNCMKTSNVEEEHNYDLDSAESQRVTELTNKNTNGYYRIYYENGGPEVSQNLVSHTDEVFQDFNSDNLSVEQQFENEVNQPEVTCQPLVQKSFDNQGSDDYECIQKNEAVKLYDKYIDKFHGSPKMDGDYECISCADVHSSKVLQEDFTKKSITGNNLLNDNNDVSSQKPPNGKQFLSKARSDCMFTFDEVTIPKKTGYRIAMKELSLLLSNNSLQGFLYDKKSFLSTRINCDATNIITIRQKSTYIFNDARFFSQPIPSNRVIRKQKRKQKSICIPEKKLTDKNIIKSKSEANSQKFLDVVQSASLAKTYDIVAEEQKLIHSPEEKLTDKNIIESKSETNKAIHSNKCKTLTASQTILVATGFMMILAIGSSLCLTLISNKIRKIPVIPLVCMVLGPIFICISLLGMALTCIYGKKPNNNIEMEKVPNEYDDIRNALDGVGVSNNKSSEPGLSSS